MAMTVENSIEGNTRRASDSCKLSPKKSSVKINVYSEKIIVWNKSILFLLINGDSLLMLCCLKYRIPGT
jgi:hypothetical protein